MKLSSVKLYPNSEVLDNQFIEKIHSLSLTPFVQEIGPFSFKGIKIIESNPPKKKTEKNSGSIDSADEHEAPSEENNPKFFKYLLTDTQLINAKTIKEENHHETQDEPAKIVVNFKNSKKNDPFDSEDLASKLEQKMVKGLRQNYQQSVMSAKSDRTKRKLELMLTEQLDKLSFAKFRESHFLFIIYFFFQVLLAVTIYVSYYNGQMTSDKTNARITLILETGGRKLIISELAREVLMDQMISEYYSFVMNSTDIMTYLYYVKLEGLYINNLLVDGNALLERLVDEADDQEIADAFHEKNVRMYYGDFGTVFTSQNYILMNNLRAGSEFVSIFQTYLTNIFNKNQNLYSLRKRVHANIYNDFFIKYEEIEALLQENVEKTLNKILDTTKSVYICCFTFLAFYMLSLFYVTSRYYFDTLNFLKIFPNHSSQDLMKRIRFVEKLKLNIDSDINRDLRNNSVIVKEIRNDRRNLHKHYHVRKLFNQFIDFLI